jgi:hypothetical protein
LYSNVAGDCIDERNEPSQLVLGEQIDLQIQVAAPLGYHPAPAGIGSASAEMPPPETQLGRI